MAFPGGMPQSSGGDSHAQALRQRTRRESKRSFPGLGEESCSQSEEGSEKASGNGCRDSGQAGRECILEGGQLGGSGDGANMGGKARWEARDGGVLVWVDRKSLG